MRVTSTRRPCYAPGNRRRAGPEGIRMILPTAGVRVLAVSLAASTTAAPLAAQQWQPQAPPPLRSCALAFDLAHDRTVCVGGEGSPWTFEYEAVDWRRIATAAAPPLRSGGAVAYDVARNRTVLFGGASDSGALLADTWEYDGAAWQQIATTGPAARVGHAL